MASMVSVEQTQPSPSGPSAPDDTPGSVVTRVRRHLGAMLMLVALAAAAAGAALATLVARREASAAITAAAALLAVTLVLAVAIVAERRSLRRVARRGERAPVLATAVPPPATAGNGSDWIEEPAAATVATSVRGQADLLEELLHWPPRRGA